MSKMLTFKNEEQAREYLSRVPINLWGTILSVLPMRDIAYLCSVNHDFRTLCKDQRIWKEILLRECNAEDIALLQHATHNVRRQLQIWRIWSRTHDGTFYFTTKMRGITVVFLVNIYDLIIEWGVTARVPDDRYMTQRERYATRFFANIIVSNLRLKTNLKFENEDDIIWSDMYNLNSNETVKQIAFVLMSTVLNAGFRFDEEEQVGITCSLCNMPALVQCSSCIRDQTCYCSQQCADTDWPIHKDLCLKLN